MLSILWSKYSASKFIYVRWSKSEMYGVNTGKHFQAKIIIIQTRNATTVFFFFSYLFLLYIYVHKKCPTVFRKTEKLKKRERERLWMVWVCCVRKSGNRIQRRERHRNDKHICLSVGLYSDSYLPLPPTQWRVWFWWMDNNNN